MGKVCRNVGWCIVGAVLLPLLYGSFGYAHDRWVAMREYVLSTSRPASFTVAKGHHFPALPDEAMPHDRIGKTILWGPDGQERTLVSQDAGRYQSATDLDTQGTYLVVVTLHGGFSSKTAEGYQQGKSKRDLKGVIECRYVEKNGKALFTVG